MKIKINLLLNYFLYNNVRKGEAQTNQSGLDGVEIKIKIKKMPRMKNNIKV